MMSLSLPSSRLPAASTPHRVEGSDDGAVGRGAEGELQVDGGGRFPAARGTAGAAGRRILPERSPPPSPPAAAAGEPSENPRNFPPFPLRRSWLLTHLTPPCAASRAIGTNGGLRAPWLWQGTGSHSAQYTEPIQEALPVNCSKQRHVQTRETQQSDASPPAGGDLTRSQGGITALLIPFQIRRPRAPSPASTSFSGLLRSYPRRCEMEVGSRNKQQDAAASSSAAAFLNEDIIIQILSRVPYRSLCRFMCVSKSCRTICSDTGLSRKSPQTLSGFFYRSVYGFNYPSLDERCHLANLSGRGRPMVDPSLPFLPSGTRIESFIDCCNGLLLCRCSSSKMSSQRQYYYVVCNPATEKWTVLPDTGGIYGWYVMRLGFDPTASPHFRVFLLVRNPDDLQVTGVEIYSMETGIWTYRQSQWSHNSAVYANSKCVFFNGIMHFTTTDSSIITVDMEGKTWGEILTPLQSNSCFLGLSQGHLYLAHINHTTEPVLSIWILKDYGSEQWIPMHIDRIWKLVKPRHLTFQWYNEVIAIHPAQNLIFCTAGWQKNLVSYDVDRRVARAICAFGDNTTDPYLPYTPCFLEWPSDELGSAPS